MGCRHSEFRLEKIKTLGPEGRDQERKEAQWTVRSEVSDALKQDCSSL